MSYVTNIILVTESDELQPIVEINEWLRTERGSHPGVGWGELSQADEHAGGTKSMEIDVYLGAFNHLVTETFVSFVLSRGWSDPECVVLIVQTEQGPIEVHRARAVS